MSEIVGGIFTSHVPGIGAAIAKGLQQEPYWKPFFDGFEPVHRFLERERPDVAVMFYNDHGLNFFLDKMPTFAIGCAPEYRHEDEGWGIGGYKPYPGHPELSWHIVEQVVADEFDPVTCQSMAVDHGVAVPFELCWPETDSWPVRLVPVCINTVQHPLPSPKRCLELGRSIGRALESWPGEEKIVVLGTGGLSHQLDGQRAGYINAAQRARHRRAGGQPGGGNPQLDRGARRLAGSVARARAELSRADFEHRCGDPAGRAQAGRRGLTRVSGPAFGTERRAVGPGARMRI